MHIVITIYPIRWKSIGRINYYFYYIILPHLFFICDFFFSFIASFLAWTNRRQIVNAWSVTNIANFSKNILFLTCETAFWIAVTFVCVCSFFSSLFLLFAAICLIIIIIIRRRKFYENAFSKDKTRKIIFSSIYLQFSYELLS